VLEFMDADLLQTVLHESGLIGKQFHIIFDLTHIIDIGYRYKLAIANLLFNWKPVSGVIGFYNIPPPMRIMVESFAAVAPEGLCVLLASTYEDVVEKVMAYRAGTLPVDECKVDENGGDLALKNRFLVAGAKMTWFNMLEEEVSVPAPDCLSYPFFKVLESIRSDLLAKEIERENTITLLKQDFEKRITQMQTKMNAQVELNKKSTSDYEQEIATLKARIATQDMELTRVSTAIAEKTTALRDLLDQIHALEIDPTVKRVMTDSCLNLIETETIEKRLNIELTESDSVFLSKLQKIHRNLNQRELRISLLVKLNYDTVSIARSVGISTRGMESIRYRMHKKLGLGKHQSIKTYLSDFAVAL
jgi:DNA-binding CsgD family transcriptional regulator